MMHTNSGYKIFAVIGLAAALSACMGNDEQMEREARAQQEKRVTFVNETSHAAAKAAGFDLSKTASTTEIANDIDALGCPKLSKLVNDMTTFVGTTEKPLPASFVDYLSCFGINGNGTLDDIDVITEKLQNPTELLDCICGSSALSDLLAGKIELFSAQASAAAQVFKVSDSKTADSYDGSKSKAADNFSNK